MVRYKCATSQQKSVLWERWSKGDSLREIGKLLERGPSAVFTVLSRAGEIQPNPRTRSARALTSDEREIISKCLACGESLRTIAKELNRAPSTVSWEIRRKEGRTRYRAITADQAAWKKGVRPKQCKLLRRSKLTRVIAGKLKCQWSPRQIAGWLKRRYPKMSVTTCHTRSFTEPCIFKPEGCKKRRFYHVCAARES